MVVPLLAGVGRALWRVGEAFTPVGDRAVLELGVRRALEGAQLLGPYSRFEWSHPGPAYFYVQSVPYGLTGGAARSMFLGAVAVNLGCALATVLVVRRRAGESAARWAAFLLTTYLLIIGPAVFSDPWNPYVIALPLLLTLVLAAAGAAGSGWLLVGAAGVGSCVVQTHVGTLVPVATALTAAMIGYGVAVHRRRTSPSHSRRLVAAGVGLLVLIWLPPLWQQVTADAGNLTHLVSFFRSPPAFVHNRDGHPLDEAAEAVADQLVVLPAGVDSLDHRAAHGVRGLLGVFAGAAATVVVGAGWRQRRTFPAWMGLVSVTAAVASVGAAARIVDVLEPYLIFWVSVLLLPAWIGLGVVGAGSRWGAWMQTRAGWPIALMVTVGAVTASGALSWSALRTPDAHPSATEVATAHDLSRGWMLDRDADSIHLVWDQDLAWPVAAGLALQLQRDGVDVSVDDKWMFLFGDQMRSRGQEDAVIGLSGAGPPPGTVELGRAGLHTVWARPDHRNVTGKLAATSAGR